MRRRIAFRALGYAGTRRAGVPAGVAAGTAEGFTLVGGPSDRGPSDGEVRSVLPGAARRPGAA